MPPCLVINWNPTGLEYVPVSFWTVAKEGSKKVPIAGIEDKRQIIAVFTATMEGDFLPPQLRKTTACLPSAKFLSNWHITFTPTHWANEATTLAYIDRIILPYIKRKKRECDLANKQCALCIFDNFKAQLTDEVLKMLEDNNVDVVYVTANCTDCLQLLDLSVNKLVKKGKFELWYSDQMSEKGDSIPIKFPMQLMKPLGAQWMMDIHCYIQDHPEIIKMDSEQLE